MKKKGAQEKEKNQQEIVNLVEKRPQKGKKKGECTST